MDSGFEIKYRKLFRTYYANLLFYAKRIVGDDDAEDVVCGEVCDVVVLFTAIDVVTEVVVV